MSRKYSIGDQLEVRVERIVPRGFGIAFAEGLTVFVPLSAPGDRLVVRIRDVRKRIAFAEIVEILENGAERIEPPCKYFGTCGGCDFQQLNYSAQLHAKVGIIRDCLHRIGKIEYDDEIKIVPSPSEFDYRSRARWHIDRDKKAIGYFARDSHNVIDIDSCPIITPELELVFENIRQTTAWKIMCDDRSEIEAAVGGDGQISVVSDERDELPVELSFASNDDRYLYSGETFFQANKFLINDLIDAAIAGTSGDTAFDLYCGVGLFTLPLARKCRSVIAVEENPLAIQLARKNIANAGLENAKVFQSGVREFLSRNKTKTDFILIDPPRAGTEKEVIASIVGLRPSQISYVSCEPSILARDLRILMDAGYKIEKINALDMFPQTHHVETVVRLSVAARK